MLNDGKKKKNFPFQIPIPPQAPINYQKKNQPKAILYNNSVFQELERVSRELKKKKSAFL